MSDIDLTKDATNFDYLIEGDLGGEYEFVGALVALVGTTHRVFDLTENGLLRAALIAKDRDSTLDLLPILRAHFDPLDIELRIGTVLEFPEDGRLSLSWRRNLRCDDDSLEYECDAISDNELIALCSAILADHGFEVSKP